VNCAADQVGVQPPPPPPAPPLPRCTGQFHRSPPTALPRSVRGRSENLASVRSYGSMADPAGPHPEGQRYHPSKKSRARRAHVVPVGADPPPLRPARPSDSGPVTPGHAPPVPEPPHPGQRPGRLPARSATEGGPPRPQLRARTPRGSSAPPGSRRGWLAPCDAAPAGRPAHPRGGAPPSTGRRHSTRPEDRPGPPMSTDPLQLLPERTSAPTSATPRRPRDHRRPCWE
jgi:hypothetical protein